MVMIPPKPRTIWRDFKSFFSRGERHNFLFALPALAVPFGLLWIFGSEVTANLDLDEPTITYAYVWEEGRTDEQIIERQRELSLAENERRAIMRERFQAMARASGVDYDEDAAAEADRITEENRQRLGGEETETEDSEDESGDTEGEGELEAGAEAGADAR